MSLPNPAAALRRQNAFAYAPVAASAAVHWSVGMHRELVERAQAGDHAAFSSLARDAGARLYGIALRITRDPGLADDAVQEAMIHAWRDLPSLRDPDRFEAWLTQVLVRRCYRELRRPRVVRVTERDSTREPAGADHAIELADRDELSRAFRHLTPEHRAVLVLRFYAGMEPTEIASTLGVAPGTVRSRLHYAISAMRSVLDAEARRSVATRGDAR